jgi:hypothetical protein
VSEEASESSSREVEDLGGRPFSQMEPPTGVYAKQHADVFVAKPPSHGKPSRKGTENGPTFL